MSLNILRITENDIAEMPLNVIVSSAVLCTIQAEPKAAREQLKAVLFARMAELGADSALKSQIKKTFSEYDKADAEMEREFQRQNADTGSVIDLAIDQYGKPVSTIDNFLKIMQRDDHFAPIMYNEFSMRPEKKKNGAAEPWEDADDAELRHYIETEYGIHNEKKESDAFRILLTERAYHPVRQAIEAVTWDGVTRIENMLIKWLKCEDTPYAREVSRLIFAGGINRIYNPGCKFDETIVLIGTKQGEGKSTFARFLAIKDEWFRDISSIEGKDGMEILEGGFICELSELIAVKRSADVEAVKSYVSRQVDRHRRSYDKWFTNYKRQCVFIGTTNTEQFLTDKTGNRRFLPIKVYSSGRDLIENESTIRAEIMQCWAEALVRLKGGKMPACPDFALIDEIKTRQKQAEEDDYMVGIIENFLTTREKTCVLEIWKYALGNQFTKPTRRESNEIVLALQKLEGWEKSKVERSQEFGNQMHWHRKIEKTPEPDDGFPF